MKINKLITQYGVINKPTATIARLVITHPSSAKSIIDKPVEKGIAYIVEKGIKLIPVAGHPVDKNLKLNLNG